jgi:hypothetical protein
MPIQRTTKDGKPGYRYGDTGKVYTYTPSNTASRLAAKKKAIKQGLAIVNRTKRPAHF